MKYYKITCGTPFLGEENDFYESGLSIEDLHERGVINECLFETGNEWYDEQTLEENDMDEDDYYANCYVIKIEEITQDEYYEACPWEKNDRALIKETVAAIRDFYNEREKEKK